MKRLSLLILAISLLAMPTLAAEQVTLNSSPEAYSVDVLSSDINTSIVRMELNHFERDNVTINGEQWTTLSLEGRSLWNTRGLPAVPTLRQSLLIPDNAQMSVRILDAQYQDFTGVEIAPSKGSISRDIDPATVSYEFNDFYSRDEWFPKRVSDLGQPYIMRDNRGQVLEFNPFRYNPSTGTLRVYTSIEVEVSAVGPGQVNVLNKRPAKRVGEFEKIYDRHFINNTADGSRYTTIPEVGNMLIVAHESLISTVMPLADWKNQIGIPTTVVGVGSIGGTATAIKAYIQEMYDTVGVTFVMLVGDVAQVPYFNNGGASDPSYGLLAGTDSYPEAFIGRLSAENPTQLQTQVQRTIAYERDAGAGDWYSRGYGIASNDGTGGDDGEMDWEHLNNIRDDLLAFTYTEVGQNYEPTSSLSQALAAVNAGLSFINYTGHGALQSWSTTGFNNGNVNSLTNDSMLPFIISVACNTGEFQSGTCFGEAWLRATNGTAPTGAIGFYGSTISQDWDPPMCAQDEIADLLVNNAKRTYGALCVNGSCQMMDEYPSSGTNEFKMWTVFGDPSVRVRTASPTAQVVSHYPDINPYIEPFVVQAEAGALVALSHNGAFIGSAFAGADGVAEIDYDGDMPMAGNTIQLTVSNFNKVTYLAELLVSNGLEPTCDVSPSEFVVTLQPERSGIDELRIANNGEEGSTLYYDIAVTDPNFPVAPSKLVNRNISGSTLVVDVAEYLPGATVDVTFTVSCSSPDYEYIKNVLFDLPEGVVCNSATSLAGGSNPIAYNGATGDGANGAWMGTNYWGDIENNQVANATVNMTFADVTGDVVIPFTIEGDIYGGDPHTVNGELLITMAGPNVSLSSPNGGELLAVGSDVTIDYIAAGGPESVKIELTRDGSNWETLATGEPVGSQSFNWTVTGPISAECRIKVTDEGDASITDTSANAFTIYRELTWCVVGAFDGQVPEGETDVISLTFDTTGLPMGVYQAEIMITNSTGTPVMVPVQITVASGATGVDEIPLAVNLAQNHPNPFNPSTTISFALPANGPVTLKVFDISGRVVRSLVNGEMSQGSHQVYWDGNNDQGQSIPSGMYFYRLETAKESLSRKMMLVK